MIRRLAAVAAALVLSFVIAARASADSLVFEPVQDAFIAESGPNLSHNANVLVVGADEANLAFESLMRFDLTSIPAGVIIQSAGLELYQLSSSGVTVDVRMPRIDSAWNEVAVTWNTRPFVRGEQGATTSVGTATGVYYAWDVAEAVRGWVEQPSFNFGLAVISNGRTAQRNTFGSAEAVAGRRPRLTVTFAFPTLTPTLSPTLSPSRTMSPTTTLSPTRTPTLTPTLTRTRTGSPTRTGTKTGTPTWTQVPTRTGSPTRTGTVTTTPTISLTATASRTATITPTAPPSATPTKRATATNAPSTTASPTATSVRSATATSTVTASATATHPDPTTSATVTQTTTPLPPACPGDCRGDGAVTVDELVSLVNIALGNLPISICDNADVDHNGEITIEEIVGAVNRALSGC